MDPLEELAVHLVQGVDMGLVEDPLGWVVVLDSQFAHLVASKR